MTVRLILNSANNRVVVELEDVLQLRSVGSKLVVRQASTKGVPHEHDYDLADVETSSIVVSDDATTSAAKAA